jgi:hypothetical protein
LTSSASSTETVGAEDFTAKDGMVSATMLYLLFFFIGVTEDDDLAIDGQPKEPTVEVTEESLGKLCILWGVKNEIFLIWRIRKIHH